MHHNIKPAYGYRIDYRGRSVGDLVEQTRKTYQGPLVVDQDLMPFTLGDDIKVTAPPVR